jgi:hypothetical protein
MPSLDDAVESGLLSNMSYQAMELIANMFILANFVFGQSQRNGSGQAVARRGLQCIKYQKQLREATEQYHYGHCT